MTLPQRARVVIVGSGIAGSSIAYHLTQMGWDDVVVVEQGVLIHGTTSHAPGLVGQMRASVSLTKMLMYSVSLYKTLEVDGEFGYSAVGSLRLASSPERMVELRRQEGFARAVGLEAQLLGPRESLARFPLMDLAGVEGGLFLPDDGAARATILATALRNRACAGGARFFPHVRVDDIVLADGRVSAIVTSQGTIETECVVAASGIWSPRLGRMVGVTLPLVPMQHQYAMTAPLAALEGDVQVCNLRDPDKLVYWRQDGASLVLGGYERDPAMLDVDAIPAGDNPTKLAFDPPRFDSLLSACIERVPCIGGVPLIKQVNGLESFTPDGEFILGESHVKGFWAACGFCAHGVSGAGGVGRMMAEWIVEGEPSLDLWHMDIRRFGSYAASRRYVKERVHEIYSKYYDITYPAHERSSARQLRLSPLYGRLQALGAVFGEKAGWERPNYFSTDAAGDWPQPRGWAARHWSPAIGLEHQATRERVAMFDETSFSKFEVNGAGALAFLQGITGNQMDQPLGTVTYTQMLNRRGGIECDLTVTRLSDDRFQIVTGTSFGMHDLSWMRRHLPPSGVNIVDITSSRCCIGVWGPRTRDLMQAVSESDFSNAAFPYLTAREVLVGEVPVLAVRVTYVGELGWELYAPTEYGVKLWDLLWAAGQPLGVAAAGYRAIDSLRLEKGYRYWSADIHSETNPYEAGLGFAVKLNKGDFVGHAALERSRQEGLKRRLCCLVLDDERAWALGGEAVLDGDVAVGQVTSGGYGYTVRKSIAYAYLPLAHAAAETRLHVLLAGEAVGATVTREPLYDPRNERVRG